KRTALPRAAMPEELPMSASGKGYIRRMLRNSDGRMREYLCGSGVREQGCYLLFVPENGARGATAALPVYDGAGDSCQCSGIQLGGHGAFGGQVVFRNDTVTHDGAESEPVVIGRVAAEKDRSESQGTGPAHSFAEQHGTQADTPPGGIHRQRCGEHAFVM